MDVGNSLKENHERKYLPVISNWPQEYMVSCSTALSSLFLLLRMKSVGGSNAVHRTDIKNHSNYLTLIGEAYVLKF